MILDTVTEELDRMAAGAAAADAIELPPDATSLDFLQAIYRDPRQPIQRRMRAALGALPLRFQGLQ
jgi:hypothetical protein